MKWDGYGASIKTPDNPKAVIDCLAESLETIPAKGPSMRRYGETIAFHYGDRMGAWLGFDKDSGSIYIEAKGETTPRVVEALRSRFPDHAAPRLDVCEDYSGEGAFESLQALIRATKGAKVKGSYVALPDDTDEGRTWAAGVRGGVSYVRQYEPGKMKERMHLFAPTAVRVELEARPHYARDKQAAATMQPLQVWGLSAWTQRVGEALTQCPIPRFEPEIRRYTHDKTTAYIARTFRRHLVEMLANGEDLKRTFESVWQQDDHDHTKYRKH
jgi:hypothetical protein